jgi:two-component system, NtrC family, sensor histidine kinase KinB
MGIETAFSYSDDRVAAIIDSLDQPAFVLDETDTVIHLNAAAAEVVNLGRDRLIGCPFDELARHCDSCARIRAALKHAGTSSPDELQMELVLAAQGHERNYVLKAAPLRMRDGTSFGILLLLRDASRLDDKSRAQDNGIVSAAQRLNTPLTSLSLAVGLLEREKEKQNELIREITEDVDRLNHASADFLNVMREQPGSIALRSVGVDLRSVFATVSRKFEDRIEHKKIEFAIHAEGNLKVSGDPLKLSWVIATLVGNALRHTPEAGRVDLTAEKEDDLIRITVWDGGPGIRPETRELVFESALENGNDLRLLETGFSLCIAREIVQAHGGRLFAEKLADGGSVTLTLPLAQEV